MASLLLNFCLELEQGSNDICARHIDDQRQFALGSVISITASRHCRAKRTFAILLKASPSAPRPAPSRSLRSAAIRVLTLCGKPRSIMICSATACSTMAPFCNRCTAPRENAVLMPPMKCLPSPETCAEMACVTPERYASLNSRGQHLEKKMVTANTHRESRPPKVRPSAA